MLVHFNQSLQTTRPGAEGSRETFAELSGRVVESLATLLQQGQVDQRTLSRLHIHLDWIQYRANFRDPIVVRRAFDAAGALLPLAEIAIDLRQVETLRLTTMLAEAQRELRRRPLPPAEHAALVLGEYGPLRDSVIWQFNRLFWQRLAEWEAASGQGFEAALPSGRSDANHPQAIADSVGDFWTLLRDLEARAQLPAEIFALEVGIGSGTRARIWLDRLRRSMNNAAPRITRGSGSFWATMHRRRSTRRSRPSARMRPSSR